MTWLLKSELCPFWIWTWFWSSCVRRMLPTSRPMLTPPPATPQVTSNSVAPKGDMWYYSGLLGAGPGYPGLPAYHQLAAAQRLASIHRTLLTSASSEAAESQVTSDSVAPGGWHVLMFRWPQGGLRRTRRGRTEPQAGPRSSALTSCWGDI